MPRKLQGSVYEDKTRLGTWRAMVTDPITKKKLYKRFNSEAEANAWRIEKLNEMNKGAFVAPSDMTVSYWLAEWMKVYVKPRPKVSTETYERYSISIGHLQPLYNFQIQQLTSHDVQKFYASSKLSNNSLNKSHKLLKAALKQAVANQIIYRNPLEDVPSPTVEKPKTQIMPVKDLMRLLDFMKGHEHYKKFYPIFLLSATTGARIGEILALSWEDIDERNATIFIHYSVKYNKTDHLKIGKVKTAAANRKISIPKNVMKIIASLKKEKRMTGLVFCTKNNTPYSVNNIAREWRNVFTDFNNAKDDKDKLINKPSIKYYSIHKMRHTHATMLIGDKDISIADVAARLGHSRISHTLDLYSHALPAQDKAIAIKIDKIYK